VNETEKAFLETTIRAAVMRVLSERSSSATSAPAKTSAPVARILVAVCCGDCLNDGAKAALEELKAANFELIEPDESDFEKRQPREKLVAGVEGVLLPSIGDDDASRMANGIFDEPVARVALTAIATGKPLFAALHSPYAKAIQNRTPELHRVWESHRRVLENFGFEIAEYSALPDLVRARYGGSTPFIATSNGAATKGKILVTAREVEAASKNGASLKLPLGAIVTPLARDRAKELNVKIN